MAEDNELAPENLQESEVGVPGEEISPAPVPEEEGGIGSMQHTVDELPPLSGKGVGDTIVFSIESISDDGQTYTMIPASEPDVPVETEPAEGAIEEGVGRDAVAESIL